MTKCNKCNEMRIVGTHCSCKEEKPPPKPELSKDRKRLLTLLPPLMEEKLIEKSYKDDNWREDEWETLFDRIEEEVRELRHAVTHEPTSKALRESGVMANYLAMIVDKLKTENRKNENQNRLVNNPQKTGYASH
jgi:NTP pyrophosphatase (non-canonical NTP hydrolase)